MRATLREQRGWGTLHFR
jgi:hypothetical protein